MVYNINKMQNTLRIEVEKDCTNIIYIDNGTRMFSFSSPVGIDEINKNKYNENIASTWFSYILWCLHSISYIDPIPTTWNLCARENEIWFSSIIERYNYTQFYTRGKKVRVIICKSQEHYERHQKTIAKFKI